jgi:murein L,D-transpeptidase YcbB/YkuD
MRSFLLATSAAALALTFSGPVSAAPDSDSAATIAPQKGTDDGLVFSKDAGQATPIQQTTPKDDSQSGEPRPAELAKPADEAKPVEQAKPIEEAKPIQQAKPANGVQPADAVQPAEQAQTPATPALASEDVALAGEIKTLVESKLSQFVPREHDRAGVLAFYQARNFAPLWIASGKPGPRAEQARAFLQGVGADGLNPADYPTPSFSDTDPQKLAANELTLTNSVITFTRHASVGRVAYTRVSAAIYFDQKAPAAPDVLGKIAESKDARAALDSFNPQSPQYKALKAELAAIHGGKSTTIVDSETVKGPAKDGKVKKHHEAKTDAAPKSPNTDTIVANMERWRWMPHDLGPTYVMVNIPDYTLKVVQDGKTVWSTKIVVGKPGSHATPLLTETMKYITVNPTWNVPPSIIRNEYLPALARDPGALARIGLQVGRNSDGSIRIFQPPGERNALGRIRFNFPNKFLVYQHDTPDKHLFNQTTRAYSHGCMRVQYPDQYAEVLLGVTQPDEHYTAAKIRSMYGHGERTLTFKHPIPVYITYQTAFADGSGKFQTRSDVYGLDRDVLRELHGDHRNSDVPIARNYNSSSKPVRSATNTRARRDRYVENPGYTTWDGFGPRASSQSAFGGSGGLFGRW